MKRTFLGLSVAAVLMVFGLYSAAAQQGPAAPSPAMQEANDLFNQKKYVESAAAFADVVKKEPQNPRAWFLLGMSFHMQGKYDQAVLAFEKNLSIIPQNTIAMYNVASGYSRLKRNDEAFQWIDKILKTGPGVLGNIDRDPDMESVRADARYPKVFDTIDRAVRPCKYSAESRQLDFWIGRWDVFAPSGQKVGVNVIEPFAEGCSLMENWTATVGGSGKSINYYDATTKYWYQHWIGSGGGALRYVGAFKDGAMRFEAETTGTDGKKTLNRLTFSKNSDGSVRQFAETSNDDGKTWTVSYDFKYVKAK